MFAQGWRIWSIVHVQGERALVLGGLLDI